MTGRHEEKSAGWRPDYPIRKDAKIHLSDCELQTSMSDGLPRVTIIDTALDDPAFFWIDDEHIYLRANWGQWFTVGTTNQNHIAMLCARHYARITLSMDNEISEIVAPVFHVGEIPPELSLSNPEEPETGNEGPVSSKEAAISMLKDRVPQDMDAMAFTNVALNGELLDLVVCSDDVAIVFDVYPEGMDYIASPEDTLDGETVQEANLLAAGRIKDLVKRLAALREAEPDAELHAAIIANETTIGSMRDTWNDKLEEARVILVEYQDFKCFLGMHFQMFDSDDDD